MGLHHGSHDHSDGRWMTYAELAESRGIEKPSAVRLVFRKRWSRRVGNDGTARVLVPQGEELPPSPSNTPADKPDATHDMANGAAHGEPNPWPVVESLRAALAAETERVAQERERRARAEGELAGARSALTVATAALKAAQRDTERAQEDAQRAIRAAQEDAQEALRAVREESGQAVQAAQEAAQAAREEASFLRGQIAAQEAAEEARRAAILRVQRGRGLLARLFNRGG